MFTPDLKEIYWSTIIEEDGVTVLTAHLLHENGGRHLEQARDSVVREEVPELRVPFVSPDGKRLYFAASATVKPLACDLYCVDRVGTGWSGPINLGGRINTGDHNETQPTVSQDGTIYFVGFLEKARTGFGLFLSRPKDGKYQTPVVMDERFNSLQVDWTPYMAPDESYFIFLPSGKGDREAAIYTSASRGPIGSWGKVVNMGDRINTDANERFPECDAGWKVPVLQQHQSDPGRGSGWPRQRRRRHLLDRCQSHRRSEGKSL